mmetsp:Transcript_16559/g.56436  ORF Transcript_16559/g.56436 Transcript_16559/m.56436 type:complete len:350 (-) Transcript_16559:1029-2078(-)|eukprot:CAMPEP_0183789978 /NCGR_PEP_ID=MMETSP0803_2-20130417/743_1 /TAXON_ID=195967 /ORGANISM="Crustomastix stigmata, Strain CCMP3273" /LENGTH=349 /DNA_ID=CAMNT_0026034165 /DNA_START=58 /DNA_END=1107 /DNA_ORIENTATION=+
MNTATDVCGISAVSRAVARAQAAIKSAAATTGIPHFSACANASFEAKHSQALDVFRAALNRDEDMAVAVAAIKALTSVIQNSEASTMMGLEIELNQASNSLRLSYPTSITLSASCELFMRYVTRTQAIEFADLHEAKSFLIARGGQFADTSLKARARIAELGEGFVHDGSVVLCHGYSRVVLALLQCAVNRGKHFSVIVTEGRPDAMGFKMVNAANHMGVPVRLVLDSAAACIMETVDMVLVGAEGVLESGGVVNKLGTFQLALAARTLSKPFYVAAESYKFARLFPVNQRDLPLDAKPVAFDKCVQGNIMVESPSRDYCPPGFISLLFTDLGVLTPAAVSDELIQLYR